MNTSSTCPVTTTPAEWQPRTSVAKNETRAERVKRFYSSPGGPLIAWLFDECRRRGQDYCELARDLGVTYGYIAQLRNGFRLVRKISDEFAVSCARYLGVPTVVVKVIAGRIPMSDFVAPRETEEDWVERAMARLLDDPVARNALPEDAHALPLAAKRALVAMYVEYSGIDLLCLHQLPEMVRWLQRLAVLHDESEAEIVRGHRDVSSS
jgi:hypothetical protein